MSFIEIKSLWDGAVPGKPYKNMPKEKFRRLKELYESSDVVKAKDLTEIFKNKIEPYCNVTDLSFEVFECFKSAFVITNEYLNNISDVGLLKRSETDFPSRFERLKINDKSGLEEDGDFQFQVDVMPTKLQGYTTLWKLVWLTENEKVYKKARNLLVYIHMSLNINLYPQIKEIREDYLKICFQNMEKLRFEQTAKDKKLRCFDLIHRFMDMSNMTDKEDDSKCPRLHCELDKGKLFTITVQLKLCWNKETIQVYSNMLVCDLLSKCMEQFRLANDFEIYLTEPIKELVINKQHNTRTISSLGVKNYRNWELKTRIPPESYLIQYDDTLNPKARELFTEWFENYSDNGKMNAEQCAAFVESCNIQGMRFNRRRITTLFDEFDYNRDGYLTLDNFLEFYFQACQQRPNLVWNDLSSQKINRLLKKQKQSKGTNEVSPAYNVVSLISSNHDFIELLFSLLQLQHEIASNTLELLNRLPINPQIFSDIVLLKGVKNIYRLQKQDWSYIFDESNPYKLLYCLSIVEYLVDQERLCDNDDTDFWSMYPKLLKHKKTWLANFRKHGGLERLDSIINNLPSQS